MKGLFRGRAATIAMGQQEDPQLGRALMTLSETKGQLEVMQAVVAKKTASTEIMIEDGKKVSEALHAYGEQALSLFGLDNELGEVLVKVAVMENLLNQLTTQLNEALREKVEEPVKEFIAAEISGAEKEKKQLDKLRAQYDAAEERFKAVKGVRGDARSFELEQERNMSLDRYSEGKEQALRVAQDAVEKNQFVTVENLCGYIDAYDAFFKGGVSALEQLRPRVQQYRQYAIRKRGEYKSKQRAGSAIGSNVDSAHPDGQLLELSDSTKEIVHEGWVTRKSKHGAVKEWAVVKYKYLYCYNNPTERNLKEVVTLVHCSVEKWMNKRPGFAINGRLHSHFFQVQDEIESDRWIKSLISSIENPEAHNTRGISGKVAVQGVLPDFDEEELDLTGITDPIQRLNKELIVDEKNYIKKIGRISSVYHQPLLNDPRAKLKISQSDLEPIFSVEKLKSLEIFHQGMLAALLQVDQNEDGTLFISKAIELEKVYIPYVSKVSEALSSVSSLCERNSSFRQFIADRSSKLPEGNDLSTLLALPISRPSRYLAYLIAISESHPPSNIPQAKPDHSFSLAVERFQSLVGRLDDCSMSAANLQVLLRIRRQLHAFDGNLVDPRRTLKREGGLQMQKLANPSHEEGSQNKENKRGMVNIHTFLFNDMILFTKPKTANGKEKQYKVIYQLPIFKTRLTNEDSIQGSKKKEDPLVFKVEEAQRLRHAKPKIIKLRAGSLQEKMNWLYDINSSIYEIEETRKIFGVRLEVLMANSREKGRDIPAVLHKITDWLTQFGLKVEGIFRLPGNLDTIEDYKDLFNRGNKVEIPENEHPYTVSGLLSHWIIELPDPLFTRELQPEFISALGSAEPLEQIKILLMRVPFYNRMALQHLFSFFQLIVANKDVNKMGPANIGIVFGPTLLGTAGEGASALAAFAHNQKVVEFIVIHYEYLFQHVWEERKEFNRKRELQRAENKQKEDAINAKIDKIVSNMKPTSSPAKTKPQPALPPPTQVPGALEQEGSAADRRATLVISGGAPPPRPLPPPVRSPPVAKTRPLPPPGVGSPQIQHTPAQSQEPVLRVDIDSSARMLPTPKSSPSAPRQIPTTRPPTSPSMPNGPIAHEPRKSTISNIPSRIAPEAPGSSSTNEQIVLPPRPAPHAPIPLPATPNFGTAPGQLALAPAAKPRYTVALPPLPPVIRPVPSVDCDSDDDDEDEDDVFEVKGESALVLPELHEILKEGWLSKKGGKRRNWQTRWFVLTPTLVTYYKRKGDAKPKGAIALVDAKIKPSEHKPFCFAISLAERTYLMIAKDDTEKEEWLQAILAAQKRA